MSIRFVLGRAGSGKTHHCLEALRSRLRESRLDGTTVVFLVPEQASLQMERALIEEGGIGAYSRVQVLSFRRLALRVLGRTVSAGKEVLSPLSRVMVLRHLLERNRKRLRCYGRVLGRPGFVKELGDAITELIREQIEPDQLSEALHQVESDSPTAGKLHDLSLVYSAYADYLAGGPADPERFLDLAAERLTDCEELTGCELFVDGFAGFTRQESSLLVKIAGMASTAQIALLADPQRLSEPAGDVASSLFRLFSATERTYFELLGSFAATGVPVEPPVLLPASRSSRFSLQPAVARLERDLFAPRSLPADTTLETHNVKLFTFPDRRTEVQAVLTRVQDLVRDREHPVRYRDIALIVRDLEPYHDLISAACGERNIPVFIDRRRPVAHHPLVEFLRALCLLNSRDFSLDSVCLLIKTGLVPIDDDRLDRLENYARGYGIAGHSLWRGPAWGSWRKHRGDKPEEISGPDQAFIDEINRTRDELIHLLGDWAQSESETSERTGSAWVGLLEKVLSSMAVAARLESWAVQAEEDGRPDEAMEHRQVWVEVQAALGDLGAGLGKNSLDIGDFAEVLEAGLAELTLGLTPPTLDQLLAGTIERSRHPSLKAVFLLGFNERVFPRVPGDGAILNDEDRDTLAAASSAAGAGRALPGRAPLRLGPTRKQRLLDERFLAYVAVTRASEFLWISSVRADEKGREMFPSPFMRDVQSALPGLALCEVGDPEHGRSLDFIGSSPELSGRIAGELGSRPLMEHDPGASLLRGRWNRLYNVARQDDRLRGRLLRALSALAYENNAGLDGGAVDLLYSTTLRTSVTRLESFARCPFQHFARHALRLSEREEHRLEAIELGTLSHRILERFVQQIMQEGVQFHELDEEATDQRLAELAARAAGELHDELLVSEARNQYLIERCAEDLKRVIRGQQRWSRHSRFRPRAVELAFGLKEDDSLPRLLLQTPKGRRLELRGIIDRVDLAELERETLVAVIDYKRQRNRTLSLTEVFHGLALQLVSYLLALQKHGETWLGRPLRPAGAFYLTLLKGRTSVDHPDQAVQAGDAADDAGPVVRGLLDADFLGAFDTTVATGRSSTVAAFVKKDGSLGYRDSTDVATGGEFESVLEHVTGKIVELADRICDGNIRVYPARLGTWSPCSHCEQRPVCRFDFQTGAPHMLSAMKRPAALERMGSIEP